MENFVVKWKSPKSGRVHQSRKSMTLGEAKYIASTSNKKFPDINHWVEQVAPLDFKHREYER